MNHKAAKHPWYIIVLLILAGEAVFILPFVLARVFRPTFLATFDLTNLQLGYCFSIYGFVALTSYLWGGLLADKYPPRKLMAVALWLTALGGVYLGTFPELAMLKVLYGFWGFTTIFLFWAAMIKATRIWGGEDSQGIAFGFLDGGRGLVGALFGSLGVLIFSVYVSSEISEASIQQRKEAFAGVVWTSSAIVAFIGLLVFFFLKMNRGSSVADKHPTFSFNLLKQALKLRAVWLLMIIILSAYVGYKITDVFSLYASDVMKYNEVDAAKTGTYLLYIRPVVGVMIGFLADRSRPALFLVGGFLLSIVGAFLFISGAVTAGEELLFLLAILVTAIGIYAARVLYFAVMKDGKIPIAITGTAVGAISFIGYTPDIFAGPAMGYLLDSSPGLEGHRHVFMMLAAFSVIGLFASIIFLKHSRTISK